MVLAPLSLPMVSVLLLKTALKFWKVQVRLLTEMRMVSFGLSNHLNTQALPVAINQ